MARSVFVQLDSNASAQLFIHLAAMERVGVPRLHYAGLMLWMAYGLLSGGLARSCRRSYVSWRANCFSVRQP